MSPTESQPPGLMPPSPDRPTRLAGSGNECSFIDAHIGFRDCRVTGLIDDDIRTEGVEKNIQVMLTQLDGGSSEEDDGFGVVA